MASRRLPRRVWPLAGGFLLVVGSWLGLAPAPHAGQVYAQAGEAARIRVEITDDGFNGKPEGATIEVEEGRLVELTFVFAQTQALGDRHIVVLNDYGLETDEINYYNREATLRFIANKPGRFEFKCDLDCDIHHHMKTSNLVVRRSGAGGATGASASPVMATALAVEPSTWFLASGPLTLKATLKDAKGAPVGKATVHFFVDAEFAGRAGKMEIGTAKTDANGMAALEYEPTFAGKLPISAEFSGMGLYAESQVRLEVQSLMPNPAYVVAPIGLGGPRSWAPRVVVLVLLAIWSTFAYVLFQAYRISRARS